MFTRRGFVRVTAASVGSLALRPFGLLPALAQSGSDYRALVCVFLFGGNDSNNTIVPMDDASYQGLHVHSREPGAERGGTDAHGVQHGQRALRVSREAGGAGEHVFVEGTGGGGECGVAGAAVDARPVPGAADAGPAEPVFARRSAIAVADVGRAGQQPHRMGGRVADYIEAQKINSSSFPVFFSVAGNALLGTGATTQPVAVAPGGTLQLAGFNSSAASQARMNAMNNLLTLDSGVSLAQAANETLANSIERRHGARPGAGEGHAAEDAVSRRRRWARSWSRWRRSSRWRATWG